MDKKLLIFGLIVILVAAVILFKPSPSKKTNISNDTFIGTYSGILPCADCSGLETVLTLSGNHDKGGKYQLRETYLGKDVNRETSGKWSIITGTATDSAAKVVRLDPETNDATDYWLVKDKKTLQMLSGDKAFIDAPFNLNLTKLP